MENSIYIGLSRLNALQQHMNVIANNLANMNTTGFKANKMLFNEYMERPQDMDETMSMVLDRGTFRVKDNGTLQQTGNQLDVAIEGPGFIGVQGPNGQTMYTRNGAFAIDAEQQLVTQQGYPVLDSGGQAISIPAGQTDITIDETGSIATETGILGTLMVQEFDNIDNLEAVGNNLYKSDKPGKESPTTRVVQGALEGSNTQAITEMTDMIEVSRSYQSVSRALQNEHDRIRNAIKTFTNA